MTSQLVTVLVNGDTKNEANETFTLNLLDISDPTNPTPVTATGTITNDDAPPTVSIGNPSVQLLEGNSGTTTFVFTASLSAVSGQSVTVQYATSDGTATIADNDYQATSGTLTFAAGTTSQLITVLVNGDTTIEPNENFNVTLSNPVNATLGATAAGVGTIINDDGPHISFTSTQVTNPEGNSGTTNFLFTVTDSVADPTNNVTVVFTTEDGTATVADGDYVPTSGTLTFTPTVTSLILTVAVNGDTRFEPDEDFSVVLSNPTDATLDPTASTATGTITNDDTPPTISITSVSQPEGNSGTTPFVFTVSLSAASGETTTVGYSTANGTATTADNDYVATSGTLTFAPDQTTQTITVLVNGDTTFENDETFNVNLTNPSSNATPPANPGVGTITNDDTAPVLAVGRRFAQRR